MFVKREKRGFTLIELLVVIAIIAILAAILFPVFSRAREQARKTACLSNAKQLGLALMMYAQDWDETLPFWRTKCHGDSRYPPGGLFWTEQILPYVKNKDVFRCPSARDEGHSRCWCYPARYGRPDNDLGSNYGYNELLLNGAISPPWGGCADGCHHIARLAAPSETVVIADNQHDLISPWARIEPEWINPRIAFANYNNNGDIACGCPARLTVPLDVALDRHARHTGGAILVFADGHAKWYKGDQIKPKAWGGQLRICGPDFTR